MSHIYIPGQGHVDLACRRVNAAVREYDERLFATRSPHTGEDTVFIKLERGSELGTEVHGEQAFPVRVFPEGFPEPHYVVELLTETDATRHGDKVLRDLRAHNERLKEAHRYRADQASGELAEVLGSANHRLGLAPYHQSIRKRDPKQRGA